MFESPSKNERSSHRAHVKYDGLWEWSCPAEIKGVAVDLNICAPVFGLQTVNPTWSKNHKQYSHDTPQGD
jgi:hypothetical protein